MAPTALGKQTAALHDADASGKKMKMKTKKKKEEKKKKEKEKEKEQEQEKEKEKKKTKHRTREKKRPGELAEDGETKLKDDFQNGGQFSRWTKRSNAHKTI